MFFLEIFFLFFILYIKHVLMFFFYSHVDVFTTVANSTVSLSQLELERREELLSRVFAKMTDPMSCLHHLLPPEIERQSQKFWDSGRETSDGRSSIMFRSSHNNAGHTHTHKRTARVTIFPSRIVISLNITEQNNQQHSITLCPVKTVPLCHCNVASQRARAM